MQSSSRFFIYIILLLCSSAMFAQQDSRYTQIKLYTNLYSQKANFDITSAKIPDTARRSFVTNILELNFVNPDKRAWFGIDVYYRASLTHRNDDSPFQVLRYQSNSTTAQTSLSHIGPKINWKPIKGNDKLGSKLIALVPVGSGNSGVGSNIPALDNSGLQIWAQLNYNTKLAEQFYGYAEFSFVGRFGRDAEPKNDVFTPFKVFLSYFPTQGLGVFGFVDYTPTITDPTAFYFQPGGGIKIFPSKSFEIELSASSFVAGKNAGAGYSFNLGLNYKFANQKDEEPVN